jgi:hypothetical protein
MFGMHSYIFNTKLDKNSKTTFTFNVKALKKWDFLWDLDLCIDSDISCLFNSIRIVTD